ncbi:MAG: (2,3-dihydroxybenzoyl)adenylate synthase [Cellvibrionaceae bacterium]|nr:(2,3-dihydroxybenzoyl)adenylate synthase [Cellvibrionaceae bacterium]
MSGTAHKAQTWPEDIAARYRREGYWKGIPLGQLLRDSAALYPDQVAVIDGDRRWTYQQLDNTADALAAGLYELGIRANDKVVVQLPNVGELAQVIFALFRLGAVPVFALPAHRACELENFCKQTQAKTYITIDRFGGFDYRALARYLKNVTALQRVVIVGEAEEFIPFEEIKTTPIPLATPAAHQLALLQLSGGTTSIPKLIPRTHDDYFYSVRASAEICELSNHSVYLAVLPAVHNFPLSSPGVLGTWYAGGTVVLAANGAPETAFALIAKHQVTITALVPPLALAWLSAMRHNPLDLSSLAVVQVGGAKLSAEVAKQMLTVFPGHLQQVFGMAEGLVNYTRLNDPQEIVIHTQGRPISPADEIRVVDEEDNDVETNQLGQLLTRGPYTIRGYFPCGDDNLDRQNARNFTADGFYRTGDLVRLTEQGYLIVEGRCKDQINRGGEKISAEEVENHLLAHPAVHDVAMVGISDPYLGERNCVCVIPATGDTVQLRLPSLRAFLRDRGLAEYKLPDRVEILETFPKTSFGKVSKKALRELIADLVPQT